MSHANSSDIDRISLYIRITSALRSRISEGEWPVGGRIPNLEDLCAEYKVSRNTMRQALQVLQSEEILKSSRGKGTFVTRDVREVHHDATLREVVSNPLAKHPDLKIEVISRTRVTEVPTAFVDDLPRYDSYVRIRKRHFLRGTTFALADFYLEADAFDSFPADADKRALLSQLVEEHSKVKFASWWQEISIWHPDSETAQLLNCSMAAPVVRMKRRRFDAGGRVMLAGVLFFRGDMFVYEIDGVGTDAPGSKVRTPEHASTPGNDDR